MERETPLRLARRKRNLTLEQVAQDTGLDVATLSRLERGRQWPTQDRAEKLIELFPELSVDQLAFPWRGAGE